MKIKCKCKEEVDVNMYFYDVHIFNTANELGYKYSEAHCRGKAICPLCGHEINEYFSSIIDSKDIIKLAVGKEIR